MKTFDEILQTLKEMKCANCIDNKIEIYDMFDLHEIEQQGANFQIIKGCCKEFERELESKCRELMGNYVTFKSL